MLRRRLDGLRRRAPRTGRAARALLACLALAVPVTGANGAAEPQVEIRSFRFEPATLEVAAGSTVTWVNRDEEVHAVVSDEGGFRSPALEGDEPFSHRFERPGTYEYRCVLHPQMKGTVVVR